MSLSVMFAVFIFLYLLLIWKAGKVYPILYLFLFTYFIQYIFSTYLIYFEYKELKYQMSIGADAYFGFAIPAVLSLAAGILIFNKDIDLRNVLNRIDAQQAKQLGYLLLAISYFFDILGYIGFPGIMSIVSFTTYVKYLAAFCFLYTRSKFNYLLIVVIYLQLAASALEGGVFISFFIWATYLFFFISLKFDIPFWLRSGFIVVAVPILILVQSVKEQYRKETWVGKREAGIELFTELAAEESEGKDEPFSQSKGIIKTVGRLTQGWHLGLTLKHVPSKEPFSEGGELSSDIFSSILPRILYSDKKTVNSQDKFYQYTGHKLYGNTSMTIGILGDFYINFGRWGAYVALFILGALVAVSLKYFITRYVLSDPINIIWIPLILTYLIRANNDFYIFFNGLLKGFILFLIINYIRKKMSIGNSVPHAISK